MVNDLKQLISQKDSDLIFSVHKNDWWSQTIRDRNIKVLLSISESPIEESKEEDTTLMHNWLLTVRRTNKVQVWQRGWKESGWNCIRYRCFRQRGWTVREGRAWTRCTWDWAHSWKIQIEKKTSLNQKMVELIIETEVSEDINRKN